MWKYIDNIFTFPESNPKYHQLLRLHLWVCIYALYLTTTPVLSSFAFNHNYLWKYDYTHIKCKNVCKNACVDLHVKIFVIIHCWWCLQYERVNCYKTFSNIRGCRILNFLFGSSNILHYSWLRVQIEYTSYKITTSLICCRYLTHFEIYHPNQFFLIPQTKTSNVYLKKFR